MSVRGDRIRRTREERGWTQADLADLMEVSVRTVQRVEATDRISSDALSAFCAIAEVDRVTLLARDAPPATRRRPILVALACFLLGLGCGLTFAAFL